jgi:hypothetical protein
MAADYSSGLLRPSRPARVTSRHGRVDAKRSRSECGRLVKRLVGVYDAPSLEHVKEGEIASRRAAGTFILPSGPG